MNTTGSGMGAYYFNGVSYEHIDHPDTITVLKQIYKANNGTDMPEIRWTDKHSPWWNRL